MKGKRKSLGLSPWDMRKLALRENERGNKEAAFKLLATADEEDDKLFKSGAELRAKLAKKGKRRAG